MPQLIKKIESDLTTDITNDVILVKSVVGEVQQEDYINMGGFIAFLQDFSKTEELSTLTSPYQYGLKNSYNLQVKTLNINY
jgi:hypothetical protein